MLLSVMSGEQTLQRPEKSLTQPRSHLLAANVSHRCPFRYTFPLDAFLSSQATGE